MTNPENNWVHVSIKAMNGNILDARAEDGDTLRALVDGALGVGTYEAQVEQPFQKMNDPQVVENQAIQNLQNGGVVTSMPGLQQGGGYRDQQRAEVGRLGVDPLTGAAVELHPEGKYGPFVKDATGLIASIPKGMHPSQVTIQIASEVLASKRQYNATKGR